MFIYMHSFSHIKQKQSPNLLIDKEWNRFVLSDGPADTLCVLFLSFSLFPRRPVFSFLWFGSLNKNAAALWICSSSAREAPGDEGRNECLSGKPDSVAFPTVSRKMGSRQTTEERFIRINFQKPINYAYALPNYLSELVLEDGPLGRAAFYAGVSSYFYATLCREV